VVKRRVELTMNRAKQHEGKRETKTKRKEKTEKEKKKNTKFHSLNFQIISLHL